jgi:hypothetical protein
MASKAVGPAKEHLAEIAIDAVKQIVEQRGDRKRSRHRQHPNNKENRKKPL